MSRPDCSCALCTTAGRRKETEELAGASGAADLAAVAIAILLPTLALIGMIAAWLVGR